MTTEQPLQGGARLEPSALLRENPIIAVLRARDATDYDAVIDVLAEKGVHSVELTLSSGGRS